MNRARGEVQEAVRTAFGAETVQEARAALAAPASGEAVRREHFVAPDGVMENDGSQESPWDLAFVLSHPSPVRPGDVIWLMDGRYSGPFTSELIGARGQPIVLRAMPEARAVLTDCGKQGDRKPVLTVNGQYTWFWGLEVTGCSSERRAEDPGSSPADLKLPAGIDIYGPDIKIVNSAIHDAALGIGSWASAKRGELYGNIIYNNGWDGPDRGHGHGIYVQNEVGTKAIQENIIFRQFGNGIHAYAEEGPINHLRIVGNVAFLNGAPSSHKNLQRNILVGGQTTVNGLLLEHNYTYHPLDAGLGGSNNVGYQAGCEKGTVANNYFASPAAMQAVNCAAVEFRGNYFVGEVSGVPPGPENEFHAGAPAGVEVVVIPNAWERGRATVVVYNWDDQESVAVDLSDTSFSVGDNVRIRDVEDYFGEPRVVTVSEEEPFTIPMTDWTAAAPEGMDKPKPATPTFGVFVLEAAGESSE